MKAVVVLADGFEEIEAVTPIDLLRRAGVTVSVAGLTGLAPRGARGISVACDVLLKDLEPDWDALILPGGLPGAKNLAASDLLDSLMAQTVSRGSYLAAICASPVLVLGARGYLRGKSYTGYPGTRGDVEPEPGYAEEPVVVDGTLVTSRGVGTAAAFALKLVELLAGAEKSREIARATLLPADR